MTKYWLMKSEPDVFSFSDLKKKKSEPWTGVRNYQARNFMRDDMKIGDVVFFYHSSCEVPGIAGIATVSSNPYPDSTQYERKSEYFDPKSTKDNPRWILVDVTFEREPKRYLPLEEIRSIKGLSEMRLLQKGNRLSILPVSPSEAEILLRII